MECNGKYAVRHLPLIACLSDNMRMRNKRHFIKEWRKHRGLTQIQLAERADVTQAMVSRVEKGKEYGEEFLERVAVALNVTPADLLMRDPTEPESIFSLWETLGPVERVQAVNVIRAIKTGTHG